LFLYVTDVVESPDKNIEYIEKLRTTATPILCLINKIDLFPDDDISTVENFWRDNLPNAEIIKISALNKINTEPLLNKIINLLPESHPWFPTDQLTDKPDRFIVSEIIREKILQNYQKEIPYSCEVVCEEFKEDDKIIRIRCVINVERDTQKGIIIGNKGAALKKTATLARLDMEKFFGKKIFLETFVKVKKDWRNNELLLRRFGY
jgi:GTP-binding protein Era